MPCFEYTEGYMGEYFIPLAHYLRLSLAVHTHCSRSQYTPTALARCTHPLLSLAVHTHCSRSQYTPTALARSTHPLLSLAVHTHCSRSQYTPTALARSTHPLLSLAVQTCMSVCGPHQVDYIMFSDFTCSISNSKRCCDTSPSLHEKQSFILLSYCFLWKITEGYSVLHKAVY